MQDLVTSKQLELIDGAKELIANILLNERDVSDEWVTVANRWLAKYNVFDESLVDGSVAEAEF